MRNQKRLKYVAPVNVRNDDQMVAENLRYPKLEPVDTTVYSDKEVLKGTPLSKSQILAAIAKYSNNPKFRVRYNLNLVIS